MASFIARVQGIFSVPPSEMLQTISMTAFIIGNRIGKPGLNPKRGC